MLVGGFEFRDYLHDKLKSLKVQRWPNDHDAAEKRIGHWFDKGSLSCRRSECGCKSNKESNYCPNCGAEME